MLLTQRISIWEGNHLIVDSTTALAKGRLNTQRHSSSWLPFSLFHTVLPQAGKDDSHPPGQVYPQPSGQTLVERAAGPSQALKAGLAGSWQFSFAYKHQTHDQTL